MSTPHPFELPPVTYVDRLYLEKYRVEIDTTRHDGHTSIKFIARRVEEYIDVPEGWVLHVPKPRTIQIKPVDYLEYTYDRRGVGYTYWLLPRYDRCYVTDDRNQAVFQIDIPKPVVTQCKID